MADSPRIEELKRRVQLDPASIAFAALAEEYRRAGQFDESIITCKAGLLRHPAYLSARVTLGRSLLELGRYDEARRRARARPEGCAGEPRGHPWSRGDSPPSRRDPRDHARGGRRGSIARRRRPRPSRPPAPKREPIPIRPVPVASVAPTASSAGRGARERERKRHHARTHHAWRRRSSFRRLRWWSPRRCPCRRLHLQPRHRHPLRPRSRSSQGRS